MLYPKHADIASIQLHGFSDASEDAYSGVVYFRAQDRHGDVYISLVISKTKVAPIKRLTIPRLELCGAKLLAQLLHHTQALRIPTESVFAWTDSTIVLSWLVGNPRRFKTFVGNRVPHIMELIPPNRWNHVSGQDNPADCASRGLFPSELVNQEMWWNAPEWLRLSSSNWPIQSMLPSSEPPAEEERGICLQIVPHCQTPVIPLEQFSSFLRLKHVTAWIRRFIDHCHLKKQDRPYSLYLSTSELEVSEAYWISLTQRQAFTAEIEALKIDKSLQRSSHLFSLHPFLDSADLL